MQPHRGEFQCTMPWYAPEVAESDCALAGGGQWRLLFAEGNSWLGWWEQHICVECELQPISRVGERRSPSGQEREFGGADLC